MKDDFIRLGQVELLIKRSNGRLYIRRTNFSGYTIKSLARYVYERIYGELPKHLEVHHKDLNPHNDNPDNLIAVDKRKHSEIHSRFSLNRLKEFLLKELRREAR